MILLEEAKLYLRVDAEDEDAVIASELEGARRLVAGILRKDEPADEDSPLVKAAVLYTLAYLNEHREEADHHALTITLRNMLFGEREPKF
jgi:hypothetical protein